MLVPSVVFRRKSVQALTGKQVALRQTTVVKNATIDTLVITITAPHCSTLQIVQGGKMTSTGKTDASAAPSSPLDSCSIDALVWSPEMLPYLDKNSGFHNFHRTRSLKYYFLRDAT